MKIFIAVWSTTFTPLFYSFVTLSVFPHCKEMFICNANHMLTTWTEYAKRGLCNWRGCTTHLSRRKLCVFGIMWWRSCNFGGYRMEHIKNARVIGEHEDTVMSSKTACRPAVFRVIQWRIYITSVSLTGIEWTAHVKNARTIDRPVRRTREASLTQNCTETDWLTVVAVNRWRNCGTTMILSGISEQSRACGALIAPKTIQKWYLFSGFDFGIVKSFLSKEKFEIRKQMNIAVYQIWAVNIDD